MLNFLKKIRQNWCNFCVKKSIPYERKSDQLSRKAKIIEKSKDDLMSIGFDRYAIGKAREAKKLYGDAAHLSRIASFWRRLII